MLGVDRGSALPEGRCSDTLGQWSRYLKILRVLCSSRIGLAATGADSLRFHSDREGALDGAVIEGAKLVLSELSQSTEAGLVRHRFIFSLQR